MKKLLSILLDTAWGPATAWVVSFFIGFIAFNLTEFVFSYLPFFLCALLVVAAFIRALWKRRWKRAVVQFLLFWIATSAIHGYGHLAYRLMTPPVSPAMESPSSPPAPVQFSVDPERNRLTSTPIGTPETFETFAPTP